MPIGLIHSANCKSDCHLSLSLAINLLFLVYGVTPLCVLEVNKKGTQQ